MGTSLVRLDNRPIPRNRHEIRLFMVCRDEELRLPWIVKYYKSAGVDRMFVVDNASTDLTSEILLNAEDVHAFYTEESYKKNAAGMTWVNGLLDEYGADHWCVIVDADEVLAYPFFEFLSIRDLCAYLDRQNAEAFFSFLLDMYPRGPVKDAVYRSGQPFLEVADCFDTDPYYMFPMENHPYLHVRGGVRKRVFWPNSKFNEGPQLTKIPLVKWRRGMRYVGSTHVLDRPLNLADPTGALLHFKYFSDFADFARREFERNDRPHLYEYEIYHQLFEKNPEVSFFGDRSAPFEGSQQLVNLGLIRAPADFIGYARSVVGVSEAPEKSRFEETINILPQRRVKPRAALDLLGLFAPAAGARKG